MKPSVDHFRVFGCIAHVHVPEERRTKLDNRSITCVLLGVSEESKGYRLFDPVAKKIIVSRDVIFEEEKLWKWGESCDQQSVENLDWGDEDEERARENRNRGDGIDDAEQPGGNNCREGCREGDEEACDTGVETINCREGDERVRDSEIEEGDIINSREGDERVRDSEIMQLEERSSRQLRGRQAPTWMRDYVSGKWLYEDETNMALEVSTDPSVYEEAVKSTDWRMAMNSEIESIEKNKTWTLTELPAGTKKIGVKWVYKTKYDENGKIDKYKARLVAKGYSKKYGVDYT